MLYIDLYFSSFCIPSPFENLLEINETWVFTFYLVDWTNYVFRALSI